MTQKWLSGSRWKRLKSYSKVTQVEKVTFESLLSNFWVTFTGTPKVTFESLFRVFELFGVWGSVGLLSGTPGISRQMPGHPAQEVWFPWFRGTYRTFWPPPVHVKDPYPTGKYPDQKAWVWVPFSSLTETIMRTFSQYRTSTVKNNNGEKMVIFGADFSRFTQSLSRFIRDINGEKKTSRFWWSFSRLVFHGLPPLDSQHLNCETKTSALFSQIWPILAQFRQFFAKYRQGKAESSRLSAKETLEFFDKIKTGEFTLKTRFNGRRPWKISGEFHGRKLS